MHTKLWLLRGVGQASSDLRKSRGFPRIGFLEPFTLTRSVRLVSSGTGILTELSWVATEKSGT